jgi:Tfp pilus assembly protein PilN
MSTATVVPAGGHAVDERSLRIPNVQADLLPIEIVEARRTRKIRRLVITFVAAVALVLAAWYGLTVMQTSSATDDLNQAEDSVQTLTRQQRNFTELVAVQSDSEAIKKQLATLMATDLQWSKLLATLQAAAPKGITITGVTCSITDKTGTKTSGQAAPQLPGAVTDSVGTITLTGNGTNKTVIAAYVDALSRVTTVANPLLGDVSQTGDAYAFSVRLDITKPALGGRFTSAGPSAAKSPGTGGK